MPMNTRISAPSSASTKTGCAELSPALQDYLIKTAGELLDTQEKLLNSDR